ncbi:MAG: hypothetical protein OXG88_09620 [Gammaproteobacteria bacterium]|nr:hypothetical protein [Gammaproteobacteria bacterium]
MSPDPESKYNHLVIERLSKAERSTKKFPSFEIGVKRTLENLLKKASLEYNEWQVVPGYDLAIRLYTSCRHEKNICLEICNLNLVKKGKRYTLDLSSNTISFLSSNPNENPDIQSHVNLPDDPDQLAVYIATLLNDNAVLSQRITSELTPLQSLLNPKKAREKDDHPLATMVPTFVNVFRNKTSNWFGERTVDLNFPQRFAYSLFGTTTFFSIQSVVYTNRFYDNFSKLVRDFAPRQSDLELIGGIPILIFLVSIVAYLFAFLTSRIDHQHGPVRLFFGGFLTPYVAFTLITWLNLLD